MKTFKNVLDDLSLTTNIKMVKKIKANVNILFKMMFSIVNSNNNQK